MAVYFKNNKKLFMVMSLYNKITQKRTWLLKVLKTKFWA